MEDFGTEKLTELFNAAYETGTIPEDMLKSIYAALPKKSKATKSEENRTISLMPHAMKIFLRVILEGINTKLIKRLGKNSLASDKGVEPEKAFFVLAID